MNLKKCMLTANDCYKKGQKIKPAGIVVHSTGANNPTLRRYLAPDDGLIGKNSYNNHWNKSGVGKCVHAFIGKDINKEVQVYQTLPFDYACWGVGSGKKGSYNYKPAYIQFEICEDSLKDEVYFNRAFELAAEFCAYLCNKYNIDIKNVVSHYESYGRGYGSNHGDCDNWLKKFGKNMDWFRGEVEKKLGKAPEVKPAEDKPSTVKGTPVNYLVKVNSPDGSLNVRKEPNAKSTITTVVKNGEVFTIVEEYKGWGKLKSGAGWISLNYTKPHTNKVSKPKSVTAVAKEVIKGQWGDGKERKKRLTEAGYDPAAVQKEVNRLMKK